MVPATHSNTQSAERPASLGGDSAATQHGPWRSRARLASFALVFEHFLLNAGPTLAPWLAVGMAAGFELYRGFLGALSPADGGEEDSG